MGTLAPDFDTRQINEVSNGFAAWFAHTAAGRATMCKYTI
jgi:hypothetical protein